MTAANDHVGEEFPLLLAGEADRATVGRVSTHLRVCSDCKDELVGAVTAHAALLSAVRRAPDIATGGRVSYRQPAHVDLNEAQVADLLDRAAGGVPATTPVDLGPVFAQIRDEAAGATPARRPEPVGPAAPGRRWRRGLLAAAAVIVIAAGGTAVGLQLRPAGRVVTVAAYGTGTVAASARVGAGWMTMDASKLPPLPPDKYYEVWLVDAAQTGVLPLGPLGADRTGRYAVPVPVMNSYSSVQVTVQDNNGSPLPSKVSVLKGSIAS